MFRLKCERDLKTNLLVDKQPVPQCYSTEKISLRIIAVAQNRATLMYTNSHTTTAPHTDLHKMYTHNTYLHEHSHSHTLMHINPHLHTWACMAWLEGYQKIMT